MSVTESNTLLVDRFDFPKSSTSDRDRLQPRLGAITGQIEVDLEANLQGIIDIY